MARLLLLDAGPLGLITNPKGSPEAEACNEWLERALDAGDEVVVAEITDYEVRRELVRAAKAKGIERLDAFVEGTRYDPITTAIMRKAAELWATARNQGRQMAPDPALDCDVLLSAHAVELERMEGQRPVVVTTNVGHLGYFCDARLWKDL